MRWRSKTGEELTVLYSADTIKMHGQAFMLSVALDVTAHKQVEARHRAILRALPDWVFLVSADGVFLDCHVKDREFLLARAGGLHRPDVTDVLPPELAADLTRLFARVARTDEPATLEYRMPVGDEIRYYETAGRPLRSRQNPDASSGTSRKANGPSIRPRAAPGAGPHRPRDDALRR